MYRYITITLLLIAWVVTFGVLLDCTTLNDMQYNEVKKANYKAEVNEADIDYCYNKLNDISPTVRIATNTEYEYIYINPKCEICEECKICDDCTEEEVIYLNRKLDYCEHERGELYKTNEQLRIKLNE